MPEIRVLVCGSRTWNDPDPIRWVLSGIESQNLGAEIHVAQGGAQGADLMARDVCKYLGIPVQTFPADWDTHGRSAGPIRNKQMLDEFDPALVVAFSEHPITKGTKHMLTIAQRAGVPTFIVGHAT